MLGREVYTSNNQLGGIQIMHNNGVTHTTVPDDFEGVFAILQWLSYMPKVAVKLSWVFSKANIWTNLTLLQEKRRLPGSKVERDKSALSPQSPSQGSFLWAFSSFFLNVYVCVCVRAWVGVQLDRFCPHCPCFLGQWLRKWSLLN